MSKPTTWLWPDRVIGKRESRELRETHNDLVNKHAAAMEALRSLVMEGPAPSTRTGTQRWDTARDILKEHDA